mgnify:CR=1 FL=1
MSVPVINSPRAIERCVDKFYTTALLQDAGIPVPETVVCESPDEAFAGFRALGDVIVKPVVDLGAERLARVETAMVARICAASAAARSHARAARAMALARSRLGNQ